MSQNQNSKSRMTRLCAVAALLVPLAVVITPSRLTNGGLTLLNPAYALSLPKNLLSKASITIAGNAISRAATGVGYGAKFGPWGAVAGALVGIGSVIVEESLFPTEAQAAENSAISQNSAKTEADIRQILTGQGLTQNQIQTVLHELQAEHGKTRQELQASTQKILEEAGATREQIQQVSGKILSVIEKNQAELMRELKAMREMQEQTQKQIAAVNARMEKEFKVLGEDIGQKHAATMAAMRENLQAVRMADGRIVKLEEKMLTGFTQINLQLAEIDTKLTRIEGKLDNILGKLDAIIKADLYNGKEYLSNYLERKNVNDLKESVRFFIKFKNTFRPAAAAEDSDADALLADAYYNLVFAYAELSARGDDREGNAVIAGKNFEEMANTTSEAACLDFAYITLREKIDDKKLLAKMETAYKAAYQRIIAANISTGNMDAAQSCAARVNFILGVESQLAQNVLHYLDSGAALPNFVPATTATAVYEAIIKHLRKSGKTDAGSLPAYAKNIVRGNPTPEDFEALLKNIRSKEIIRFCLRELANRGYSKAVLTILREHDPGDDAFRQKAYLVAYAALNPEKKKQYASVLLQDPTVSPSVKEFIKQL